MILQYVASLNGKRIILASQSPRRRELLQRMGLKFEVMISNFAEDLDKGSGPAHYAKATAREKALSVYQEVIKSDKPDFDVIIASDSIVTPEHAPGKIMEKASTAEEAAAMMRELSGCRHSVFTGLILLFNDRSNGGYKLLETHEETVVQLAKIPDADIAHYVQHHEAWKGKAGAYGIQDLASVYIEKIDGDFYNVMGFPVHRFCSQMLKAIEEEKLIDVTAATS